MYEKKDIIRGIVEKLRNVFPSLKIEEVVNDLELSIEELGINILYSDMSDLTKDGKSVSGFARVCEESGRPEIVINGKEPYFRQRFTIAHELGHIILHWKWLPGKTLDKNLAEISYRSELGYSPHEQKREVQANEFAAELLLPLEQVSTAIESFEKMSISKDNNKSVLAKLLSDLYQVSTPMAAIQLKKVDEC